MMVALAFNRALPPAGHVASAIARCLLVVGASTVTVWSVDRVARRLLPLATLMRLSLVFPDQAPSRFKMAVRSGSSRRMAANLEAFRRDGLAGDPARAAGQLVELMSTIGAHDRRTRGHSERVRLFAELIGEELHLSKEDRQKLQWGALVHDLGKLTVPPEILNKPGKPTEEEWAILSNHPAAGEEMIEPLRAFLGEWADTVGGHHEKWDGSGYPRGLVGEAISRPAAIVAVADAFEVMTAVRSYKRAMPITDARAELTRCAGTHFSPEIVRAFLSISIRRLRLVGGPLAALAHLPFVQSVANSSLGTAVVGQTVGRIAAAVPSVAAGVVTGSLVIGAAGPVSASVERPTVETTSAAGSRSDRGSVGRSSGTGSGRSGTGSNELTGTAEDSARSSQGGTSEHDLSDGDVSGGTGSGVDADTGGGASTTTISSTTTSVGDRSAGSPGDGASPVPTTTVRVTTTVKATTTTAPPSTVAPTTAAPATTAAPTTTIAPVTPVLMVSTSPNRSNARALQGAPLAVGSNAYVFIWTSSSYSSVDFWTSLLAIGSPTLNDSDAPFDLAGTNSNGTAKPTVVGLLGLSVTAKFHGSGPSSTISASSSIL